MTALLMTEHRKAAIRVDHAMVLAAGLGQRMRPLTATRPKPLIEVAGRSLLDYCLARLAEDGVKTVVVNVHYLPEQIEAYLKGHKHPRIVISDERDRLLDTGGGVCKALPLLGMQPFFILNSDSLWIEGAKPALARLREAWREDEMDCLMLLASTVNSVGYDGNGDFTMDVTGRLSRRMPGEVAPFAYTGLCIAHPRLFKGAPDGAFSMNLLWDRAIEAGRLFGLRHDGIWLHVGTPDGVTAAERALQEL
ncbi:nucleotidyltransferase family protein [Rhodoligotrophos defluvii]|uniref:nucleotidyltransferase family protein n=1 Tax=Rhodoligotrophos defluvii TaxID=2561934 RepID=UPI001EF131B8|nr:nucleotidyltransferase family protein [Rhodoligotrophos defluvii]